MLLFASLTALAACGGETQSEDTTAADPQSTAASASGGCEKVAEPEPKRDLELSRPTKNLNPAKGYTATVQTSCGTFEFALAVKRAPKTTASFAHMAQEGLYDGLIFHRIVPGFVIQGGDPIGAGTGGPGYSVREAPPEDLAYTKGTVAMAKAGNEPPGTSGSQFFVMTEDTDLPPEYALLGEVTDGIEVVEKIGVVETDATTQKPVDPVVIEKVDVRAER